ncbi:MAG: SDR family oxidoreductase [Verrucomicrobiota bacterium]|nr:SDR family oxidoreductase [Verrucomicrobiota bacterium]
MDILVTGGAGFIGSNLVRRLAQDGHAARVLDNLATGRRENLRDIAGKIEFVEGDIRDIAQVRRVTAGVAAILHAAALPSVQRSVEQPQETDAVNVGGTLNVLVAAQEAGVKTLVFSSSSSVYGDAPGLPRREDMVLCPASPYAAQKLIGEHYARVFHRLHGLRTFVLRYFNVYGPRQNPLSEYAAVVPRFIRSVMEGRSMTLFGDGEQTRDFTFVADVVEANLRCLDAPPEAAGRAYNIARGERLSVKGLAATVARLMGRKAACVHAPARAGEARDSEGDHAMARTMIGWQPRVGIEDGLRRTIRFFEEASA